MLCGYIRKWLQSDHVYTVRFAIEMLMVHYLDEAFDREYPQMVASVKTGEYYVDMMIAWYFATALAKQWDGVIVFLERRQLTDWVHSKTIQKAIESTRISPEQKAYLRTLRV